MSLLNTSDNIEFNFTSFAPTSSPTEPYTPEPINSSESDNSIIITLAIFGILMTCGSLGMLCYYNVFGERKMMYDENGTEENL